MGGTHKIRGPRGEYEWGSIWMRPHNLGNVLTHWALSIAKEKVIMDLNICRSWGVGAGGSLSLDLKSGRNLMSMQQPCTSFVSLGHFPGWILCSWDLLHPQFPILIYKYTFLFYKRDIHIYYIYWAGFAYSPL